MESSAPLDSIIVEELSAVKTSCELASLETSSDTSLETLKESDSSTELSAIESDSTLEIAL